MSLSMDDKHQMHFMRKNILDYIDFDRINLLLKGFNQSTGFVTAILDLEGRIISSCGWREICTNFHRKHPKTNHLCVLSDTRNADFSDGKAYHVYQCLNGLYDIAMPIRIDGRHVANLYTGQFLFEKPDLSFFKKQAQKYGFDETAYIKALKNVPIVSHEKIESIVQFLLSITKLIIDITNDKIEQEKSRILLESSLDSPKDMIILAIDKDYKYLYFNQKHKEVMRATYGKDVEIGMSLMDQITSSIDVENAKKNYDLALSGESHTSIQQFGDRDIRYYETLYNPIYSKSHEIIGTTAFARDITSRVEIEEALKKTTVNLTNQKAMFQKILDVIPDFVSIQDQEMNILYSNWKGFGNIPVKDRKIPSKCYELLRGYDDVCPDCQAKDVLETGKTITKEVQLESGRWYELRVMPIVDENQNVTSFVEWVKDITDKKQKEIEMIEDREVLKSTLNAIGEGVIAVGLDGIVYDANPKFCQMIGCEEEKIVSRSIYDVLKISDAHEKEDRETIIRRLLKKNQAIDFGDHYVFTSKNGDQYFIEGTSSCIKNNENDCIGKVITLRDVTKEKEILDQIKYIGTHDYLTNLYNRRFVQETFIQMVEENQIPFGMLMIDLNGLKIINDAFGHHMGDIALKTTAKIFKDSFSSDCIISRIGGDEFIVLVPDISSEEQLIQYRQEVLDSLKNYTIYHMSISLAMGWVVIKNQNVDFDDVYKDVENEMYKHKLTESISVRNKAVNAIFMTLTEKYKSEKIHSERDRDIVEEIGIALKLKDHELNELKLSALFHDIGKISIPDGILNKPSSLTKDEYDIIKTHTESGYKILKAADEFSDLANHALFHHEWWDGSGYPKGIKGKDIPLFSRIISVADAFEAMTADRPYRSKMSTNEAIEELKKSAGTQFDPQIVKVFLKYLEKNPIADLS